MPSFRETGIDAIGLVDQSLGCHDNDVTLDLHWSVIDAGETLASARTRREVEGTTPHLCPANGHMHRGSRPADIPNRSGYPDRRCCTRAASSGVQLAVG